MSKQRPSTKGSAQPGMTLADWQRRLFRNCYTRAGRRVVLAGWSFKIQHRGRRHTFSLDAVSRLEAAAEAKAIYETILGEGWNAALGRRPARSQRTKGFARSDARYWRDRLLLRRYRFAPSSQGDQDLAARIDHGGQGYFFPLRASDPDIAALRARDIYGVVAERGWEAAFARFPREMIVGFEWSSNPVMWTYTTVHTLIVSSDADGIRARRKAEGARVLVAESDGGVRRALCWCVDQLTGSTAVSCESPASFQREFAVRRPQMVLMNRNLAGRLGFNATGQVALLPPSVPALAYSTCVDGDQLFISTPGGAEGYLLKRVEPERLLEPILGEGGRPNFSADGLQERVKAYFKTLLQPRLDPDSSLLTRLTRREREVLDLLSKGCVDKEIAQALGISAWTVHDHIKSIFERLGVRTRTEAVIRYLEK